jgi:hypothetical protein
MDHFDQFFATICAGLGLFLAGAANLLLLRRGIALRVVATVLALGVALAAAAAIQQPNPTSFADTARLLACGLVPVILLGSRRLVSGATAIVAAAGKPAVRYALLTVAGIGVAISSVVICDREDDRLITSDMAELELIESQVPSAPVEREKACTDQGTPIALRQVLKGAVLSRAEAEERYFRTTQQFKDQVIRQGTADERTNCHGWVFTGGKFILSGSEVNVILMENGYTEQKTPQSGDLVIYRTAGLVIHSALVQYVAGDQPVLVRSKWGSLGVFVHPIDKSPYGTDYAFYRSPRAGHLLTILPAASDNVPAIASE